MYTIETKKLLLLQEYADRVRYIVPDITEIVTVITKQQLVDLCNAGFSISYILEGNGSMFNRSPLGMELRQKQFEKHLYAMLDSKSISTMPDTANFSLYHQGQKP